MERLSSRKSSTDVESPIVLDDTLESSFEVERGSELKSPVAEKGNGGSSTSDTASKSTNAACEEAVHFDVSESTQGTSNDVQGKSKKSHQRKETKKVPQKRPLQAVKCEPWLKLNGDLNPSVLKRFQEVILAHIMINPGVLEEDIIQHFLMVLRPESTRAILQFLQISSAVTKHFVQPEKSTLFSNRSEVYGTSYTKCLTYYMPTTDGMVKMMDIAR